MEEAKRCPVGRAPVQSNKKKPSFSVSRFSLGRCLSVPSLSLSLFLCVFFLFFLLPSSFYPLHTHTPHSPLCSLSLSLTLWSFFFLFFRLCFRWEARQRWTREKNENNKKKEEEKRKEKKNNTSHVFFFTLLYFLFFLFFSFSFFAWLLRRSHKEKGCHKKKG